MKQRQAVGAGIAHDTTHPDLQTSGADYASRFEGAVGEWLLDVQSAAVRRMLRRLSDRAHSVLEVGGGHGQLTGLLVGAGHRVTVHGSDEACHRRLRDRWTGVRRVVSDPWSLPFDTGEFDLVVAIRLLAHVERWRDLLTEMARVSSRWVLVEFPIRGAMHRLAPLMFGAKRHLEGNTRPYFDYTLDEIVSTLDGAGQRCAAIERQFAWPMALHRTLGSPRLSGALERLPAAVGYTRRCGSPVLLLTRRDDEGSTG